MDVGTVLERTGKYARYAFDMFGRVSNVGRNACDGERIRYKRRSRVAFIPRQDRYMFRVFHSMARERRVGRGLN